MRQIALRLHEELVVDNFAGGGGASLGIEWAIGRSPDIAINHDPKAIAMHAANHPNTRHYCESVWAVDPVRATEGRPVGLAWFSPDCTFHSKARGGQPFRDRDKAKRRRGLAWVVVRWAKAVRPRVIMLENVEEFADWGPLTDDGRPDPLRRGFTFRRWWASMERLGYRGKMWQLRACDFGAPTTRKRLFIVFRCDGEEIVCPEPTHGPGLEPYRTAAECIMWDLPCPSIFEREKPLVEKTLARIARGLRRYVIDAAEPFIIPVTHAGDLRARGVGQPMPTITGAHRGEHALVTPYVVRAGGPARAGEPRRLDKPYRTVMPRNHSYIVAPTMIQQSWGERKGQKPRILDLHRPLGTIVAQGTKQALVAALLSKHNGGHEGPGQSLETPVDTIVCKNNKALVTSHMLKLRGGLKDHPVTAQDWRTPFPTITAGGNHVAEVRAFLIKYYGEERQDPRLDRPLHTVTTKHRFGLVTVQGVEYQIVDVGMRMLWPRELFRAQSFPDGYIIDVGADGEALTKTDQVSMCGNSVPPIEVCALVKANYRERLARRRTA
jgi:DNA (cytosine-5)-methyltransferase 1